MSAFFPSPATLLWLAGSVLVETHDECSSPTKSFYTTLFATGQWHRYLPSSWSIFPRHGTTARNIRRPTLSLPDEPLDATQKLTYAGAEPRVTGRLDMPRPGTEHQVALGQRTDREFGGRHSAHGSGRCVAVGEGALSYVSPLAVPRHRIPQPSRLCIVQYYPGVGLPR